MSLDLKFSFNVKQHFVVNGREYTSLDEMPEADRKIYQMAMNKLKLDSTHHMELPLPIQQFSVKINSLSANDSGNSFSLGKTLFILIVLIVGLLAYLWLKSH